MNDSSTTITLTEGPQPNNILRIDRCRLGGYAAYTNRHLADMVRKDESSLSIVAKAFRFLPTDQEAKEQYEQILRDLQEMWLGAGETHPHIAPMWLASVTQWLFTVPAIVMPFYSNGNILQYVRRFPDVDKMHLVCLFSSAIAYLHSKGIVHGNVCPQNICISDDGEVVVTDVRTNTLVRHTRNSDCLSIPSSWMYKAREELEDGHQTLHTDVYSFATTVYSIYTMHSPFPSRNYSCGKGVRAIVDQGCDQIFKRKPIGMVDDLWEIVHICWARDPTMRPSMRQVDSKIRALSQTI